MVDNLEVSLRLNGVWVEVGCEWGVGENVEDENHELLKDLGSDFELSV